MDLGQLDVALRTGSPGLLLGLAPVVAFAWARRVPGAKRLRAALPGLIVAVTYLLAALVTATEHVSVAAVDMGFKAGFVLSILSMIPAVVRRDPRLLNGLQVCVVGAWAWLAFVGVMVVHRDFI